MYLCGNRYRVIGCLGEGGFGRVYLVEDQILKSTWAVKEIGESDKISYSAIRAEVNILARVSHPGIVRITDVFRSDGRIYIVMDHVRGMSLKAFMKRKKRLASKVILNWGREICDAVSYLHHMDPPVILRDIKPSNIMVRPDGHIVLIDFGAAITKSEKPGADDPSDQPDFGSLRYASPEQIRSGKVSVRSDIYSIGRVLDEMSGKDKPFGLSYVIKRCTMKNEKARYRSAGAIKRDLTAIDNLGRIAVAAALMIFAGGIIMANARSDAEIISSKAQVRQAYDQSLMCFYELEDYEAAIKHLEEVPEEEYPEVVYYRELLESMTSKDGTVDLHDILRRFEKYNEETVRTEDTDRYVKNMFCMAKAYITLGVPDGYDDACRLSERVLDMSEGEDGAGQLKGKRADALKLMINSMILKGRSAGDEVKKTSYHRAIECMEKLITLPDTASDSALVIARLMDEAALYTELKEYDPAIAAYEEAERRYPYDPGIRYFAHLSLLMQTGADKEEVISLWDMTREVEGIRDDAGYSQMEERIDSLYLTSQDADMRINNDI